MLKIAVSGKGGVGKTTVSASLVYLFAQEGYDVYAVDADPDASLGLALGLDPQKLEQLTPLVDMKEVIDQKSGGGGAFYVLNPGVDDVIEDYSITQGNIHFLMMGGVKQGGAACYCKENSFLNSVLNALLLDQKGVVVLDMSAGIEHLTRGTAQGVDAIIIVAEPTRNGVKTAGVVQKLARDLGIKNIKIVGNKIRRKEEEDFIRQHFGDDQIIGFLPYRDEIWSRSMELQPEAFGEDDLLEGMKEVFMKLIKEVM